MLQLLVMYLLGMANTAVWNAQGRADAERDIAANTMKWKIFGHMAGLSAADDVVRRRLRGRFGVELDVIAFCQVTYQQVEHAKGYNDRIREAVEGLHGANAVNQVWEETRRDVRWFPWLAMPQRIVKPASIFLAALLSCAAYWAWRRFARRNTVTPSSKS